MLSTKIWLGVFTLASAVLCQSAHAANSLTVLKVNVDRPTIHALGVQVLISGDDNHNAKITIRYRVKGSSAWRDGFPLFRVLPATVAVPVPDQFGGSVFDLSPNTTYEIALEATDPDGGSGWTQTVTASTRPVPRADPATPRAVTVNSTSTLNSALSGAKAGDVITLAAGTYGGLFTIMASGTKDNPIVIRGASQAGAILDGQNCTGCNVLEVYGSYVHVEQLSIINAERAVRFQGGGTTGNVARRLLIKNVIHGIGSKSGQSDYYICDNTIIGRLKWPWVFDADATSHWDDRGVDVNGEGHVVCHNTIQGFGDPVVNKTPHTRSWDIYGNDISDSFDGTELDEADGNVRLFHNRWTNVMAPISIQPIFGGPAYVLRNVLFNIPDEQVKLKSLGGTEEPSGALIYHNTFVSPKRALNLQTPITQHNFIIGNNLFVGPQTLAGSRSVDWTAKIDGGTFDYNGYFPDGEFWFGVVNGKNQIYPNFAAAQASGAVETHGVLLKLPVFAAAFVGPTDPKVDYTPPSFTLASGSNAIDKGQRLVGINDGFKGAAPDLGALELGCPVPSYGPRPAGQEQTTSLINCGGAPLPAGDGSARDLGGVLVNELGQPIGDGNKPGSDAAGNGRTKDGCGCQAGGGSSSGVALLVALGLLVFLLRGRRRL